MKYETPQAPDVESEHAYVVYDSQSGQIRHVHLVTIYRGAEREQTPDGPEDESRALELAGQLGHDPDGLRVISVEPSDLNVGGPHRVDLKTRRLIQTVAGN